MDDFLRAAYAGDLEGVELRMVQRSRDALVQIALTSGAGPAAVGRLLGELVPRRVVRDAQVVHTRENRACVELLDVEGERTRVEMEREEGRWRVVLALAETSEGQEPCATFFSH